MSKSEQGRRFAGLRPAVLALLALAFAAGASPSNKWRMQFSGHAKVDGEIELSFTPKGGTATSVVVAVPKGTGENAAARLTRDTVKKTFGKEVYNVETDDGEDVLVKKHHGERDFVITIVENSVQGVRIEPDAE